MKDMVIDDRLLVFGSLFIRVGRKSHSATQFLLYCLLILEKTKTLCSDMQNLTRLCR